MKYPDFNPIYQERVADQFTHDPFFNEMQSRYQEVEWKAKNRIHKLTTFFVLLLVLAGLSYMFGFSWGVIIAFGAVALVILVVMIVVSLKFQRILAKLAKELNGDQ